MNSAELKSRITSMQETIQKIEKEVAAGAIPPEGTEDFKCAVDEARMRIWAVLTAATSDDPEAFLERFRLRRAIEISRAVLRDLDEGGMRGHTAELTELQAVAQDLSVRISPGA